MKYDFNLQFSVDRQYHLEKLDFLNWYRFFYLVKDIIRIGPSAVLEIGVGSGLVRSCVAPHVGSYETFDINEKLKPDILGDIREFRAELVGKYNCIVAADVLEHIPFEDFSGAINNIYHYLIEGGVALITIPHRRSNFLIMTPTQIPHVLTVPTGYLSVGAFWRRFVARKIWIDPDHCWEIGDGKICRRDVERVFRNEGFGDWRRETLLYVDYWVLHKCVSTPP